MLTALENDTETKDLPDDNELRQLSGCRDQVSIAGTRLLVKNEM